MIFQPFIYGLIDPLEPEHIRYVGMAVSNRSRPKQHAEEARDIRTKLSYKINWIRNLHNAGRDYSVLILEKLPSKTTRKICGDSEKSHIKSLREAGHQLTNATEGGDGGIICPVGVLLENLAKGRAIAHKFHQENPEVNRVALLKFHQENPETSRAILTNARAVCARSRKENPEIHRASRVKATAALTLRWKDPEFAEAMKKAYRMAWAKRKLEKAKKELASALMEMEMLK
jgi:hypothetical protein